MKHCLVVMIVFGLCVSGLAQAGKARRSDGTECAALPCVVASVALLDQTTPVNSTPLVTPAAGGLFRVTVYMESSPTLGSHWGLSFGYTDDLNTRNTAVFQIHPAQVSAFTEILRDVAGQPITYSVKAPSNPPPGASYDLFVTVEQLQ